MSLTMQDVHFSYKERPVIDGLSFTVPDRGVVCLSGPSGCGKTTVLRLLLGLEVPQSGHIFRDRHRPAVVFQEDRLLAWKTVLENVTLPPDTTTETAVTVLRSMGLRDDVFSQFPAQLSGGMRRRVAIARALAAQSDWLALDEPFTGIDTATREDIMVQIRRYAETRPVVLVTHHPEECALLGATIVEL